MHPVAVENFYLIILKWVLDNCPCVETRS